MLHDPLFAGLPGSFQAGWWLTMTIVRTLVLLSEGLLNEPNSIIDLWVFGKDVNLTVAYGLPAHADFIAKVSFSTL